FPMAQRVELAVKILQHTGRGDGGGHAAAADPAHAVAHDTPAGAIRQLPGAKIVLVFLTAAAYIGLPCDLHRKVSSFLLVFGLFAGRGSPRRPRAAAARRLR